MKSDQTILVALNAIQLIDIAVALSYAGSEWRKKAVEARGEDCKTFNRIADQHSSLVDFIHARTNTLQNK